MDEFSRLEIKDGIPYLDGVKVKGCESYRLVIDSDSGLPGTGELEVEMTVKVFENTQEQNLSLG